MSQYYGTARYSPLPPITDEDAVAQARAALLAEIEAMVREQWAHFFPRCDWHEDNVKRLRDTILSRLKEMKK